MSFWVELKRRNVVRVAALYAVVGWLVLQVAEVLLEAMAVPEWTLRFVLVLLLVGFPVALIFAWVYELTPEGIKRESEIDRSQSITNETGRKLDLAVIALLVVVGGLVIFDRVTGSREAEPASSAVADDAAAPDVTAPALPTPASPDAIDEQSIAVLPFVNMSPDPDNEYFSDGISEEILNVLAGVPNLRVAARTSSFQFKGRETDVGAIGSALKVAHVLEGSVRKSGNQVRITAQLIDADEGIHLWSETFDRELVDIFAIQDEIARAVSEALAVTLLGETTPAAQATEETVAAYDLYLLGRHHFHQRTTESLQRAQALFSEALAKAPNLALAHVGLADTYIFLLKSPGTYGDLSLEEVNARAEPALARALKLDPDLAEAHASMALLKGHNGLWEESEQLLDRAIELNPNYAMAYMWRGLVQHWSGRFQKGHADFLRTLEADPLSPIALSNIGWSLLLVGDEDGARKALDAAVERFPDFDVASGIRGVAAYAMGNVRESVPVLESVLKGTPNYSLGRITLGMALLDLGEVERARVVLNSLHRAYASLAAGQEEEALRIILEAPRPDMVSDFGPTMFTANVLGQQDFVIDLFEGYVEGNPARRRSALGAVNGAVMGGEFTGFDIAHAYRQAGDHERADRLLAELSGALAQAWEDGARTPFLRYYRALASAMNGDSQGAIDELEAAVDAGFRSWWLMENDVRFGELRNEQAYQRLVEGIRPLL